MLSAMLGKTYAVIKELCPIDQTARLGIESLVTDTPGQPLRHSCAASEIGRYTELSVRTHISHIMDM